MNKVYLYVIIITFLPFLVTGCSIKSEVNKVNENSSIITINELTYKSEVGGLQDPSLVPVGEDYIGMGQTPFNVMNEENLVLLCHDPLYNITYYVNYGEDYYIYRIKDGKKELAVDVPAKRLFVKDGNLYFIVDFHSKKEIEGVKKGNVLCYNPLTGSLSIVVDDNVSTMIVYDEGIYYRTAGEITEHKDETTGKVTTLVEIKKYFYSFDTEEVVNIDDIYMQLMKWKQYNLRYDVVAINTGEEEDGNTVRVVGLSLTNLDQSESIPIIDEFINQYMIEENKLYTLINSKTLLIINLETMEKEEIPLIMPQRGTYTKVGDKIYFSELMILDLNTKEQTIIKQPLSMIEGIDLTSYKEDELRNLYQQLPTVSAREIYTDGKGVIYGICMEPGSFEYKMKRLDLSQVSYGPFTMNNEDGIPYQVLQYEVSIEPMGYEVSNEK